MGGCWISNANSYINQYPEWQTVWPFAFILLSARVSGLGKVQEPDRALALCQWKLSENSLGLFKSGGVKLTRALPRAKFPY